MIKTLIRLTLAFVLFSPSVLMAKSKVNLETLPSYSKRSKLVILEAPVDSIDVAKRTITLKASDNTTLTTKVDPSVKNLDQIKPGDVVVVKYYESVAWKLRKTTEANPKETTKKETEAPEGNEPGMVKMSTTKLVATIEKIDEAASSVTLKKPDGTSFTVKVKDPDNLKLVKVGDQVDIRYSESMAISVEKKKK